MIRKWWKDRPFWWKALVIIIALNIFLDDGKKHESLKTYSQQQCMSQKMLRDLYARKCAGFELEYCEKAKRIDRQLESRGCY